jgi:dTDP-4-dehydrorhamnose 3,5-epimerase
LIEGVIAKQLTTHTDDRGFFREIIRVTDDFFGEGFGQWSHSLVHVGVAKAWHVHKLQTDWFYVVSGVMKVVLHDGRPDSPTHGEIAEILMGDGHPGQVVKIPPGVAHGYKVIDGPAHMLYVTSRTYDPNDEGRIAHDDTSIGYDWAAGPLIN